MFDRFAGAIKTKSLKISEHSVNVTQDKVRLTLKSIDHKPSRLHLGKPGALTEKSEAAEGQMDGSHVDNRAVCDFLSLTCRHHRQVSAGSQPGVCRYGSRIECCYGWKKNNKGQCEGRHLNRITYIDQVHL